MKLDSMLHNVKNQVVSDHNLPTITEYRHTIYYSFRKLLISFKNMKKIIKLFEWIQYHYHINMILCIIYNTATAFKIVVCSGLRGRKSQK